MFFRFDVWSWVVFSLGVGIIFVGLLTYFIRRHHAPIISSQAKNYGVSTLRIRLVMVAEIASLLLLASALFGPTFGFFHEIRPTPAVQNIVFVVDVSPSMLVQDVASGSTHISRLEASKALMRETMLAYSGSSLLRFSLVAFTTKFRTIIPPTTSTSDALRMTFSLHAGVTGADGTDLVVVPDILTQESYQGEQSLFVILTDGGEETHLIFRDNPSRPSIIVAVGSSSGGVVPQDNDRIPSVLIPFASNEGSSTSRRNDEAIMLLSRAIGGMIIPFKDFRISQLFDRIPIVTQSAKEGHDATPTFVIAALLCFLVSLIPTKILGKKEY